MAVGEKGGRGGGGNLTVPGYVCFRGRNFLLGWISNSVLPSSKGERESLAPPLVPASLTEHHS